MVSAATFTVIVALPFALPVTVITPLDTLTVATLGLLDVAEIAPLPARVAVKVSDNFAAFKARLLLLRVRLPAALPMLQFTVFAAVLPSGHWKFAPGVTLAGYVPAFVPVVVPPRVILLLSYPFNSTVCACPL